MEKDCSEMLFTSLKLAENGVMKNDSFKSKFKRGLKIGPSLKPNLIDKMEW